MGFNILGNDVFLSPEKRREKQDAYYHKMFPLGADQQEWENQTFDALFEFKKKIPTLKYISYLRRENYIDGVNLLADETELKKFKKMLKHMKISEEEISLVESLVKLEYDAKTVADLPSPEKIKEFSKEFDYGYSIIKK